MTDPTLTDMDAPRDPRVDWDVPAFGDLAVVSRIDEVVTRVVAPNPGPMTLDGTNTYVVGAPGSGAVLVVDPGPDEAEHLGRVEDVLDDRGAACRLILVTHHHDDHAAAARPWARHFDCPVVAPTPGVAGDGGRVVADGDTVDAGGVDVTAVATPGHSGDHCSWRLEHGPLLTGDHILGRGTSVVVAPDGDLVDYLASLRRVLKLGPDMLLPGHGPTLDRDPDAVVDYYLAHREFRQRQILALLEEGPQHTTRLVRRIYDDLDEALLPAAAASTRATLEKLAADGVLNVDDGGTARLEGRTRSN